MIRTTAPAGRKTSARQAAAEHDQLNQDLADTLPPILRIVGGVFVLLTVFHAATLEPEPRRVMVPLAIGTAVLCFVGATLMRYFGASPGSWGHPLAAAIVALACLNASVQISLTRDPFDSIYFILILVAVALVFLSTPWFIFAGLMVTLTWVVLIVGVPVPDAASRFGGAYAAAAGLSAIAFTLRRRSWLRLEAARISQESALRALLVSDNRFQIAVRATQDVVWDWDLRTNQVWWSDNFYLVFGYKPADIGEYPTLKSWTDRIHPEDHERVEAEIQATIQGRKDFWTSEYRFQRADRRYAHIIDRGYLLYDDDGTPTRMVGAMLDVSERRVADEARQVAIREALEVKRLSELDRERRGFVNTVAHELGNPMTPIRLQLHILRILAEQKQDPELQRSVEILHRNTERMAGLLEEIMDASRIQSEGMQLSKSEVDLHHLIDDAVQSYREPARAQGIALVHERGPVLRAQVDERRIIQVLYNLISNALKFTPQGGTIRIEATQRGDEAQVRVIDTGQGMTGDQLERLFRAFSQVHDSSKPGVRGTGLGLYICKGIVEAHGGHIEAASAGPGKGSTFTVTLPMGGRHEGAPSSAPLAAGT